MKNVLRSILNNRAVFMFFIVCRNKNTIFFFEINGYSLFQSEETYENSQIIGQAHVLRMSDIDFNQGIFDYATW